MEKFSRKNILFSLWTHTKYLYIQVHVLLIFLLFYSNRNQMYYLNMFDTFDFYKIQN